ncbi:hypothetical protein MHYMCMPASI_00727 [Hyalomma marginatum]|uniref:Uncharacterized protein n=1 Tax=Hyalomma marginatum TaxID=34627 RepID=A0A8S4C1H4_9ACAR|nr:hypothetical protein MHYMCMPASI_00727 [Hyalomma marginatum]
MHIYKKRPKHGRGFYLIWVAADKDRVKIIDFEK